MANNKVSVKLTGPKYERYVVETIRGAATINIANSNDVIRRGDTVTEDKARLLAMRYDVTVVAPK